MRTKLSCLVVFVLSISGGAAHAKIGVKHQSIFNGVPATMDQIYSTVAIVKTIDDSQDCTGTLIAPTVVVTAAHCFVDENRNPLATPQDRYVLAGVLQVTGSTAQPYTITKIVVHENYPNGQVDDQQTGYGRDDDVALVLLDRAVTEVAIASILPQALLSQAFTAGKTFTITGYGQTQESGGNDNGVLYIAQTPFVVGGDYEFVLGGNNKDTCPGDSGGPTYVDISGQLYFAGITSRGSGTAASCGSGGIYSVADAYTQWFIDNSQGAFTGSPTSTDADVGVPDDGGVQDDTGAQNGDGTAPKKDDGGCCAVAPGAQLETGVVVTFALFLMLVWSRRRRRARRRRSRR